MKEVNFAPSDFKEGGISPGGEGCRHSGRVQRLLSKVCLGNLKAPAK